MPRSARKDAIRSELDVTRVAYHRILDSFGDADLRQPSANGAWTNHELLTHMALGFFILPGLILLTVVWGRLPTPLSKPLALLLNALTRPFNRINAAGPALGARVLTRTALHRWVDWFCARSLQLLDLLPDGALQRGMYYPTRWDPVTFQTYMPLEDVFRIPTRHVGFHLQQIHR